MTDARRAATARRWFRLLGHHPIETPAAVIVATPGSPDVWDANFALARPGGDPRALLASLDAAMPHMPWRVVVTDALTEPAVDAALALEEFAQAPPLIEMLARGPIASPYPLPGIAVEAVESDAAWDRLIPLIRADHAEGRRTGAVGAALSAALIAGMRTRMPSGSYATIRLDGRPIGYGLALACPGGLGIVEHLFVLPDARGRGAMSAFIADAERRLREAGCDAILLDARSDEPAKRLYARLGFVAVAVTRSWMRRVGD